MLNAFEIPSYRVAIHFGLKRKDARRERVCLSCGVSLGKVTDATFLGIAGKCQSCDGTLVRCTTRPR